MNTNFFVATEGYIDHKDRIYMLYDFPKEDIGQTTLIDQTNGQSRIFA